MAVATAEHADYGTLRRQPVDIAAIDILALAIKAPMDAAQKGTHTRE